jgi:hypothetical protein
MESFKKQTTLTDNNARYEAALKLKPHQFSQSTRSSLTASRLSPHVPSPITFAKQLERKAININVNAND